MPAVFRKGSVLVWTTGDDCGPVSASSTPSASQIIVGSESASNEMTTGGASSVSSCSSTESSSCKVGNDSSDASPSVSSIRASKKKRVTVLHEDLIGPEFWIKYPGIIPCLEPRDVARQVRKDKKKAFKESQQRANAATAAISDKDSAAP